MNRDNHEYGERFNQFTIEELVEMRDTFECVYDGVDEGPDDIGPDLLDEMRANLEQRRL